MKSSPKGSNVQRKVISYANPLHTVTEIQVGDDTIMRKYDQRRQRGRPLLVTNDQIRISTAMAERNAMELALDKDLVAKGTSNRSLLSGQCCILWTRL